MTAWQGYGMSETAISGREENKESRMGAPMKQGDEGDGVNSSQASSVGANLAPECGGNIRGQRRCVSARNWPLRRRKGDAADRGVQKENRPPQGGLMLEQWKYQQIWQAI